MTVQLQFYKWKQFIKVLRENMKGVYIEKIAKKFNNLS